MTSPRTHEAFMERMYPGWRASLLTMLRLASEWARLGVYRHESKDEEALTRIYDELYLAVTNTTPHKPPTIEGGGIP